MARGKKVAFQDVAHNFISKPGETPPPEPPVIVAVEPATESAAANTPDTTLLTFTLATPAAASLRRMSGRVVISANGKVQGINVGNDYLLDVTVKRRHADKMVSNLPETKGA